MKLYGTQSCCCYLVQYTKAAKQKKLTCNREAFYCRLHEKVIELYFVV